MLVRRPADPDRFSGVLLVEWLNVTGGFDTDPDWAYSHEEIFRAQPGRRGRAADRRADRPAERHGRSAHPHRRHADSYLVGPASALMGCDWRINEGPHRFVAQAALHALVRWVAEGTPPPSAPRIELTSGDRPRIARDQAGIAVGGVRTPKVDVPVAVLSGESPGPGKALGWLVGSTTPFR